jgi:hypothetical protein
MEVDIMPRYGLTHLRRWLVFILCMGCLLVMPLQAQTNIIDTCPPVGIQPANNGFDGEGILLTAFDGTSLWVYDIERATRYPLPETRPCTTNCHLSPDFSWLAYMNPQTYTFSQMRLDGTQRSTLLGGVADVRWWDAETWLVWTPDQRAYLQPIAPSEGNTRTFLPSNGLLSVQPAGMWGLVLRYNGRDFVQTLTHLSAENPTSVELTPDVPYFNNASWSSDGQYLAYVGRGATDESIGISGGELFIIRPGDAIPRQLTYLTQTYGAVRINGYAPTQLSWSPDGSNIACWVTELLGTDVTTQTGSAVVHVVDVATGTIRRYCGFNTAEHTPNPSRLVWSPDGRYIAFAGNVPADDKGYLLLAMRLEDGTLFELSDGIYPALGYADVFVWGYSP